MRLLPLALVSSTLLLAACGGGPSKPAPKPDSSQTTTISGRVVNNRSGVDALGYTIGTTSRTAFLDSSTGAFNLALPSAAEVAPVLEPLTFGSDECRANVTVSSAVNHYLLGSLNATLQGQPNGEAVSLDSEATNVLNLNIWMYANVAATIRGEEICTYKDGSVETVTYFVNLVPGWNALTYARTGSGNNSSTQLRNSPFPTTEWYWVDKFGNPGGCQEGC